MSPEASSKKLSIAGRTAKGNLRDILMPHPSLPRVHTEPPDSIKTYAHPKINGEKDYLSILQTLLHEPFHLKTTQAEPREGREDVYSSGYGFTHAPLGDYTQEDFKEVTDLLLESLLAKIQYKDLEGIVKRLLEGEEIDFSQYK